MRRFLRGFQSYFKGLGIWTRNSSLLRLSLIPLVFDFVFLVWGLVFATQHISDVVNRVYSAPQLWYQYALYYSLILITAISLFLVVVFFSVTLANIIAFPFNGILAEKALKLGQPPQDNEKSWLRRTHSNLKAMIKRTIIYLVIGVIIALAVLIPGFGFIGAAISVFLMAYDRLDYGYDHFAWTFQERIKFTKSHFAEILGFATGLGLTSTIPVINILAQPGGVVAGALLVAELKRRDPIFEGPHSQTPGGTKDPS